MTTHFYRVEFRKGGRDYWRTVAVTVCSVCADHIAGFWKRERPTHEVRIEEYEFDPATIESDHVVDAADACPRCGERSQDRLVWDDNAILGCQTCGTRYDPDKNPGNTMVRVPLVGGGAKYI